MSYKRKIVKKALKYAILCDIDVFAWQKIHACMEEIFSNITAGLVYMMCFFCINFTVIRGKDVADRTKRKY